MNDLYMCVPHKAVSTHATHMDKEATMAIDPAQVKKDGTREPQPQCNDECLTTSRDPAKSPDPQTYFASIALPASLAARESSAMIYWWHQSALCMRSATCTHAIEHLFQRIMSPA